MFFDKEVSAAAERMVEETAKELGISKTKVRPQLAETALKMYHENEDDLSFKIFLALERPHRFMRRWRAQSEHLYDSPEDFTSEFFECILKAARGYLNKTEREAEGVKVTGSGSFNNYLYSTLNNQMRSRLKAATSSTKHPQQRCFLCDEYVAPMNKHILYDHPELWEGLLLDYSSSLAGVLSRGCPVCSEGERKRMRPLKDTEGVLRHMRSKHSPLFFTRLTRIFPNMDFAIRNPAPAIGLVNSDRDSSGPQDIIEQTSVTSVFDRFREDAEPCKGVDVLLKDPCLTECQRTMIWSIDENGMNSFPPHTWLCQYCLSVRNCFECPREDGASMNKEMHRREVEDLREKSSDIF